MTGGAVTLASCGNPEHELIRFVPDEDLTPGLAEIKNGVCPQCSAGCGTTIRVMQGDVDTVRGGQAGVVTMSLAKKLEGNPTHPVNQGTLCPRGQAAIQIAYHPDRITQPLKRRGARGSNDFQPITWDAAIAELVGQLDTLAASKAQSALACWTRPGSSARRDLTALFLARFGAPPPTTFELFSDDVLRRANEMSFGRAQLPTFDLAASRYAISFGADFLGTWNSPVAHTAAYGRMRQGRPGIRGAFVQVEPRMSLTGASADEWVAIRPGTEGVLALGLAHVIMREKLRPADAAGRAGALVDGWAKGLADYTPQAVEQKTSVKAARVERLARELADQRPSVAIIGGAALAQANGLFQALAVNALNALLGSVGTPGGLSFTPQAGAVIGHGEGAARCRRGYPGRRQAARAGAARRSRQPGVRDAAGLARQGSPAQGAVCRQLRQLRGRHERARGSDPARPRVPRVVDRGAARIGRDHGRGDGRRPRDEAALPDARDAGRAARRREEARRAHQARIAVDVVRSDAAGHDR